MALVTVRLTGADTVVLSRLSEATAVKLAVPGVRTVTVSWYGGAVAVPNTWLLA